MRDQHQHLKCSMHKLLTAGLGSLGGWYWRHRGRLTLGIVDCGNFGKVLTSQHLQGKVVTGRHLPLGLGSWTAGVENARVV